METKKRSLSWFGIPKLFPYLRPYRTMILWMVLMGVYGSAMDAVIPLFQRYAINHFIADSTLEFMGVFVGLYAFVVLSQVASNYISAFGACAGTPSTISRPCPSPISIRTAWAISTPGSCPTPSASPPLWPGT